MHRRVRAATYQSSGFDDFNFDDDNPTTLFRYDGQMQHEEEVITTASIGKSDPRRDDVTRYTLGPRGIDMIEAHRVATNIPNDPLLNNPSRVFPIYDGHGNMVATLKRATSGTCTLANQKRYEAWGSVRYDDGVGSSDHVLNPKARYCANIGHSEDLGTGLTYMRGRWYDNMTGRFISQDPTKRGSNWFTYCDNMPIDKIDYNGNEAKWNRLIGLMFGGAAAGFLLYAIFFLQLPPHLTYLLSASQAATTAVVLASIGMAFNSVLPGMADGLITGIGGFFITRITEAAVAQFGKEIERLGTNAALGNQSLAKNAVTAAYIYSMVLISILIATEIVDPWLTP